MILFMLLSPIYSAHLYDNEGIGGNNLRPYEFRWIEELGSTMIRDRNLFIALLSLDGYLTQQRKGLQ